MQSEDVDTLFPQSNKTQLLQRYAMELLALTAGAAIGHCQNEEAKKVNLLLEKDGV